MSIVPAKPVILPDLLWVPSPNFYDFGSTIREIDRVVLHRWADPVCLIPAEHAYYEGVIGYFGKTASQVSSHIVFDGSADPGKATQMVAWNNAAWTEMAYNRTSISIECADDLWFGKDPAGLAVLARMVAFLLWKHDLLAVYSFEKGFCRHADLGQAGGGHLLCPTTDMVFWEAFVDMVQAEAKRGEFRKDWGR